MIWNAGKGADAAFLAFRREESNAGLGFRNAELDPPLFVIERLVGNNRKAELLGVKVQGALLVAHGDGCEFDVLNHGAATFVQGKSAVERQRVKIHKSLVRLKG